MNKLTTIKQKTTITAPPNEVYEAFTDPKKHTTFTGSKATGKATVGGEFTAWDGYIWGKYLELEKGKKIVQEWETTAWPETYEPSKLELKFQPTTKGTKITMTHTNVPAELKEELTEGWTEFYWNPLKEHFKKQEKKGN